MVRLQDVWQRLIEPANGAFSPEWATYVLSLSFSAEEVQRFEDLMEKRNRERLTEDEAAELRAFVDADTILSTLKSKARLSLQKRSA